VHCENDEVITISLRLMSEPHPSTASASIPLQQAACETAFIPAIPAPFARMNRRQQYSRRCESKSVFSVKAALISVHHISVPNTPLLYSDDFQLESPQKTPPTTPSPDLDDAISDCSPIHAINTVSSTFFINPAPDPFERLKMHITPGSETHFISNIPLKVLGPDAMGRYIMTGAKSNSSVNSQIKCAASSEEFLSAAPLEIYESSLPHSYMGVDARCGMWINHATILDSQRTVDIRSHSLDLSRANSRNDMTVDDRAGGSVDLGKRPFLYYGGTGHNSSGLKRWIDRRIFRFYCGSNRHY
jgi:hypothetical protein